MSAIKEGERRCANGSCTKLGKHLCTGCSEAIYCSRDCQRAAWSTHKEVCKLAVKPQAMTSFDSLSAKQLKNIIKVKAANMDPGKRKNILDSLDRMVEKPQLVKLVEEHVKLSEVEGLLTAADAKINTSGTSSSSSSASKSSTATKKAKEATKNYPPTPTPEQLRQQAMMIRKDPGMVRRHNPAFVNMTDDQIRAYADQLEQAAADPNMMKEVERMSRMSTGERDQLQLIQEGLQGVRKMDTAWVTSVVDTLKKNPGIFKSLVKGKGPQNFGGVSEENVMQFIDTMSQMDAVNLRRILQFLLYLGTFSKPLSELYAKVDKLSFGNGKYIGMAILGLVLYLTVWFWFRVGAWVLFKIFGWPAAVTAATATAAGGSSAAASLSGATAGTASVAIPKAAQEAVLVAGAGLAASAVSGAAGEAVKAAAASAKSETKSASDVPKTTTTMAGKTTISVDGEAADAEFDF